MILVIGCADDTTTSEAVDAGVDDGAVDAAEDTVVDVAEMSDPDVAPEPDSPLRDALLRDAPADPPEDSAEDPPGAEPDAGDAGDGPAEMDPDAQLEPETDAFVRTSTIVSGLIFNNTEHKVGTLWVMSTSEAYNVDEDTFPVSEPLAILTVEEMSFSDWSYEYELEAELEVRAVFYLIAVLDREPLEFPGTFGDEDLLGSLQFPDEVVELGSFLPFHHLEVCNAGCHIGP
jgi:hypothetical protein